MTALVKCIGQGHWRMLDDFMAWISWLKKREMDKQTDRSTDRPSYRVTCTWLKKCVTYFGPKMRKTEVTTLFEAQFFILYAKICRGSIFILTFNWDIWVFDIWPFSRVFFPSIHQFLDQLLGVVGWNKAIAISRVLSLKKMWKTCENLWKLVKTSENFWKLLKTSENFWKLLKTFEKC